MDAGLLVGELLCGAVARPDEEVDRRLGVAERSRGGKVAGDLGQMRIEVVAVGLLQNGADAGVQLEPRGGREVLVERLAHQLVDERVVPRERRVLVDHPRLGRLVEDVEEPGDAEVGGPLERLQLELAACHGGHAERPDRVRRQIGEPPPQQHPYLLGDRAHRSGCLVGEPLGLDQPQHLVQEERVAAGQDMQPRGRGARGLLTRHALDVRLDVVHLESLQREPRPEARELREQLRALVQLRLALAVRADEDDRRLADGLAHEAQQHERGGVGGVQVVEQDDERLRAGALDQEAPGGVEEPEARRLRVDRPLRAG